MENPIEHLGQAYFSSALSKSQTQQTQQLDPQHLQRWPASRAFVPGHGAVNRPKQDATASAHAHPSLLPTIPSSSHAFPPQAPQSMGGVGNHFYAPDQTNIPMTALLGKWGTRQCKC